MQSPHVIHWAPDAEVLFNQVLDSLPHQAVPFVRQSGAAATVYTVRGRHASEVTVPDVLEGLRKGTPDKY